MANLPPRPAHVLPRVDLRLPMEAAEAQFYAMLAELDAARERHHYGIFDVVRGSFAQYVYLTIGLRSRLNLDGELKPIDTYFLYLGDILVGEVRIRHELPPEVEDLGGNIILYVRPSARRRGVATIALAAALEHARDRGLRTTLLSCTSMNLGAQRAMERNGGVRIGDVETPVGVFFRYRFFT